MSTVSANDFAAIRYDRFARRFANLVRSAFSYDRLKRLTDVAIASAVILILSPMFVVVALLIKFTDLGPILFVQTRIGQDGVPFSCLKFRSMRVNADELKAKLLSESHHKDGRTFKMRKDPRITSIGRIIRKFSIDEMPQLWNVVRGDMSLVGPRPSCPQEVAIYHREDWQRLQVKPGLTCIWQVRGRGDIPFEQQVQMDLEYVEDRSLWLDFKLLVMTVPAVVLAKGAY
ncbi:MAG: sugar transferase [Rubripirellula sp.]